MDKYEHLITTHVGNRILIYLYNKETEETYNLDITQKDLKKLLEILKKFTKNQYKPSAEYICIGERS